MELPTYFNIAKKDDEAEIDIFGEIGQSFFGDGFSKETLRDKLKDMGDVSRINVNISSFGGSLNDGLVIYDMLKEHPAKVTTKVYGFTASAATVIAQAGDTRLISDNAMYLVHQPMIITIGNVNEHEDSLDQLKTIYDQLINLYNKRTKKSKKELRELMEENNGNGKWITPKEAVEFGFADSTFEPSNKGVKNFSREMMNSYKLPELPNNNDMTLIEEIKGMFQEIKNLVTPKETEAVVDKVDLTTIENKIAEVDALNQDLTVKIEALEGEKAGFEARITELQNEVNRLLEVETEFNKSKAAGTKVKGVEGIEDNEANLPEEVKSLRKDIEKIKMALNPPDHKPTPINEKE